MHGSNDPRIMNLNLGECKWSVSLSGTCLIACSLGLRLGLVVATKSHCQESNPVLPPIAYYFVTERFRW
jgi:hypothetical protein